MTVKFYFDGFKRQIIPAGETIEVHIPVNFEFMKKWNTDKQEYFLPEGEYIIYAGASSEDIRLEIPYTLEWFSIIGGKIVELDSW